MKIQDSLKNVIEEWKSLEWISGSKNYLIDTSPINPNEFMITFKIEANINIGHNINPIRVRKRFFTYAQNNKDVNPAGDVHNLKILLDHLNYEFQKAIDDIISG